MPKKKKKNHKGKRDENKKSETIFSKFYLDVNNDGSEKREKEMKKKKICLNLHGRFYLTNMLKCDSIKFLKIDIGDKIKSFQLSSITIFPLSLA